MPVYELINPSDPYTLEAENNLVAAMACIVLSEGKYGLECGKFCMPPFLFTKIQDIEQWMREHCGMPGTLEEALETHRLEIASCLNTVLYGRHKDRETYTVAINSIPDLDAKQAFTEHWNNRRTSLNDIGQRAKALAKALAA